MDCNNYFKDENICTKWICACGHTLGQHSCISGRTSSWICSFGKCACKEEIHTDFSECKIECLLKIKINQQK